MNVDLTTTNVLLGILAGVQVLWLLGAVAGAMYARRMLTRVEDTVARLEREHIAPLKTRAERILSDVSQVTGRVQHRSATVEAGLSTSFHAAERQVRRVADAVGLLARETTAVASGVRAAVSAVASPSTTPHARGVRNDIHAQ